tara:strand:+ start:133 stop:384 length:252 start_codon:yes stop_codon:yes gene_type:complete
MDELLDMITQDESPSGISDAIKDMLYAKSAEKIGDHKDAVAASLFGDSSEEPEEVEAEVDTEIEAEAELDSEEEVEEVEDDEE